MTPIQIMRQADEAERPRWRIAPDLGAGYRVYRNDGSFAAFVGTEAPCREWIAEQGLRAGLRALANSRIALEIASRAINIGDHTSSMVYAKYAILALAAEGE